MATRRTVVENAEHCPFCGCEKIFLKAPRESCGYREGRLAVSLQCSRCHVNGPQIFSDVIHDCPPIDCMDEALRNDLIGRATERWNERH